MTVKVALPAATFSATLTSLIDKLMASSSVTVPTPVALEIDLDRIKVSLKSAEYQLN